MSQITASAARIPLRLVGVRNFRDLGGIPVEGGLRLRHNLLFRSGHFGTASPEARNELQDRGIRFIDLRHEWEAEIEDGSAPSSAVRRVPRNGAVPVADAALWSHIRSGNLRNLVSTLTTNGAEEAMLRLYSDQIARDPAPYAGFLASVASGGLPAVVHCSAGKDRTGWAVAVLLTALGASEAAIREDYAESSLPHNQYIIRTATGEPVQIDAPTRKVITPLLEARQGYLDAAWASVERQWGSRTSYLEHGLGLRPRILAALRHRLLA